MIKLSIIIPIYNSHKMVRRQLKYFRKLNLPDTIEIIFMDDGSEPPLKEYFEPIKIKNLFIYPTNDFRPWTQPCAKNLGVELCDGEYIFITDIDHILPKKAIINGLNFSGDKIEFTRSYAILNNHGDIIQTPKALFKYGYSKNKYRNRRFRVYKHTNTFVMRKKIFKDIGGYPIRLCDKGIQNMLDDSCLYRRYNNHHKADKCLPAEMGSEVHVFPASNIDPQKLFHNLDRRLG